MKTSCKQIIQFGIYKKITQLPGMDKYKSAKAFQSCAIKTT